MATIKGPLDFIGRIGNMRCYDDPSTGKRILGRIGGFSKTQFEKLDTLQKTRENVSEFVGSSLWASLLYTSLSDLKHLMHSRCYNKIASAGKQLLRLDVTNPHGFRRIEVNSDLQAIEQINFNEPRPLSSLIRKSYEINFLPDKKTVTLSIPGFVPATDAWWVSKYLAVRLYLVIAQISDMAWDPKDKKYEPVVPDLETLSCKVVSDWITNNSIPGDVNLSVSLDEPAFSVPGTAVVVAMGVEFALSTVNDLPYALPHSGSMKIVKCFKE